MARSFLLDTARRIIPFRMRRLLPSWARPLLARIFWSEAVVTEFVARCGVRVSLRAIRFFNRMADLPPTQLPAALGELEGRAAFLRAKQCVVDQDFTGARKWLDVCLHHTPSVADAYYLRGHVSVVQNEDQDAIRDLRKGIDLGYNSADAHFYLAIALSNLGAVNESIEHYVEALKREPRWAQAMVNLAHLWLWKDKEDAAVELLREAVRIEPAFSMAHQNLAARYDRWNYAVTALDVCGRREVLLYDAYNFSAERAFHVGIGNKGVELWGKALKIQRAFEREFSMPERLRATLCETHGCDPQLPFRLLPYEWVTQIGHIAMLDTYCKIQAIGWRERANIVLLAPPDKVANAAYLEQWRKHMAIVAERSLVNELFPLQRFIGDCFNAFLWEDGRVEAWPDVGARAHVEWDRQRRAPLLTLSEEQGQRGRAVLAELGVPRDAWFVCLHAREGGYHREQSFSTQQHRNASIQDYIPAIEAVTQRGGYVVRMGDATMSRLPELPGVIDYAHSAAKQDWMDVFLCGAARMFIGTTSGLTNAVISFGTPCVLVNCLSNFSQLWNERVWFALKPFWNEHDQRYLSLHEIVNEPVRSRVFNVRALAEAGLTPINNTPEEIREIVEEWFQFDADPDEARTLSPELAEWRIAMAGNGMFGNARPGQRFLERNFSRLFPSSSHTPLVQSESPLEDVFALRSGAHVMRQAAGRI